MGRFNEFLSAKCRLKALVFKLVAMATDQHSRVCCRELLLFTRKSKEERKKHQGKYYYSFKSVLRLKLKFLQISPKLTKI